jgi:hypothetical protein
MRNRLKQKARLADETEDDSDSESDKAESIDPPDEKEKFIEEMVSKITKKVISALTSSVQPPRKSKHELLGNKDDSDDD